MHNVPEVFKPVHWPVVSNIPESLIEKVFNWMSKDNVRWFKHMKGLKGSVDAVLRLNYTRKKIPSHSIHFREGMQIRNFLRSQPECKEWTHEMFECGWVDVIEKCILKLN
jgi:hypothetical protein